MNPTDEEMAKALRYWTGLSPEERQRTSSIRVSRQAVGPWFCSWQPTRADVVDIRIDDLCWWAAVRLEAAEQALRAADEREHQLREELARVPGAVRRALSTVITSGRVEAPAETVSRALMSELAPSLMALRKPPLCVAREGR